MLGKEDLVRAYRQRSRNYRLLFDKSVGFIRGKQADGKWEKHFSPIAWGGAYCEGSAWQNGFSVPHDETGLSALYGGEAGLAQKLDELFLMPPDFELQPGQKNISLGNRPFFDLNGIFNRVL